MFGFSFNIQKSQAAYENCTDIGGQCITNTCSTDILDGGCYGTGEICCARFAYPKGANECFFACPTGWSTTNQTNCNGGSGCYNNKTCCFKNESKTKTEEEEATLQKQRYGNYDLKDIVNELIFRSNQMLGIVGSIALLFFIVAGIKMIFSGGSQEKIGSARTMMAQTIVGLIIFLSAYLIVSFIQNTLIDSGNPKNAEYKLDTTNPKYK